jgi:hypothetical protein
VEAWVPFDLAAHMDPNVPPQPPPPSDRPAFLQLKPMLMDAGLALAAAPHQSGAEDPSLYHWHRFREEYHNNWGRH